MGCKAVIEMIGGKLYQWDTGRKVRITMRDEPVIEVHFAHDNDENALVAQPVPAGNGVCEASIPNILLQSAENISIYAVTQIDDCMMTASKCVARVTAREKPESYVYTETETLNYTTLAARLDEVEQSGGDAIRRIESLDARLDEVEQSGGTIKKIESLDTENMVVLRDLESGSYVLYGRFKPYSGADATITFSSDLLVNVLKRTNDTHVQVFYPYNNCVQYLKITNTSYERKNIYQNDLETTANRVTGIDDSSDDEHYPTAKAVFTGLSGKANTENGAVVSEGSDYAVRFEWSDGNPSVEDRTNRFVQLADGGHTIAIATADADICGVTTDTAAFVENYGIHGDHTALVGILGVVTVIDRGACTVGETCMSDDCGYAVPSSNNMGYHVMERVDENRVRIAVKPNDDMIQRIKSDMTKLFQRLDSLTAEDVGAASAESVSQLKDDLDVLKTFTFGKHAYGENIVRKSATIPAGTVVDANSFNVGFFRKDIGASDSMLVLDCIAYLKAELEANETDYPNISNKLYFQAANPPWAKGGTVEAE